MATRPSMTATVAGNTGERLTFANAVSGSLIGEAGISPNPSTVVVVD